jgi:hypothetical protein
MQCMMKEICAQCLQVHRDPATGLERVVCSCFDQDQELGRVDFGSLRARLGQNGVQEKLTKQWIDRSLRKLGLPQEAAE